MRFRSWITALATASGLALALGVTSSQAATPNENTQLSTGLSGKDLSKLPLTDRRLTDHEKANLAVVLRAYRTAEGSSLDVPAFVNTFARNGVLNDLVGGNTFTGEALGDVPNFMIGMFPDIHRELKKITVDGDVVAIEVAIQGTFTGTLSTPAGTLKGNGAKVDVPTADFWYLRNGKVEKFNCFLGFSAMYAQMGVTLDRESAVGGH